MIASGGESALREILEVATLLRILGEELKHVGYNVEGCGSLSPRSRAHQFESRQCG
jgi:hypothetical protein